MDEAEIGNHCAIRIALAHPETHRAFAKRPFLPVPTARIVARPARRHVRVAGALHYLRPGSSPIRSLKHHRLAEAVRASGVGDADVGAAHRHEERVIASDTVRHDGPRSRAAVETVDGVIIPVVGALHTGIHVA